LFAKRGTCKGFLAYHRRRTFHREKKPFIPMPRLSAALLMAVTLALAARPATAQQGPGGAPPAVGVVKVERTPITPSTEFVGRIQATNRVNLVPRVTAFLDERLFTEGAEVKKGDLLYRLEQGPFRAEVQAKEAAIQQINAQLRNATLTLERARSLLGSPAGQQSAVDAALANQQSLQGQLLAAQAQLQEAKISLDYTEIRAPIDGKIGRTATTIGNVVSPSSGVLATIVSQDPMYVVFPVSVRTILDIRERYAGRGGLDAVLVRVRLPNGRVYKESGKLDFVDNSVAGNTDTIVLRGRVPNPPAAGGKEGGKPGGERELVDGELVTVIVEDAQPVLALTVPRAAVLSDQEGDYVYAVDLQGKAQRRPVRLGQSPLPAKAVIESGLEEGETVIVEGIQRVRAGQPVSPGPAEGAAGGGKPPAARS
jgi:membrane fusion protein, multidrug efflux system